MTAFFFALYFLMATQDIAVDGWALTMLSPPHVEKGSTMNVIGQNLGSFLGFVFFLALNDADTCNTYLLVHEDKALMIDCGGGRAQSKTHRTSLK